MAPTNTIYISPFFLTCPFFHHLNIVGSSVLSPDINVSKNKKQTNKQTNQNFTDRIKKKIINNNKKVFLVH